MLATAGSALFCLHTAYAEEPVARSASPPPPAEALIGEISFRDSPQNRIRLDMAPEGHRPFVVWLDTGASGSVFTPAAARSQGVSIRRNKSSAYRKGTSLGRDMEFWVDTKSSDSGSRTGFEYGLLGGTFLRAYVVELDFKNQVVRFYNPKKFELPKQVSAPNEAIVPISIRGNRPFVEIEINGKKVQVLLDTGDPLTLDLSGKAARKVGIDVDALPSFGTRGGTIGTTAASLYEADTLRLGPFEFAATPVIVTPKGSYNQGGNTDSAIGYDLLQQFTIRIDYRRSVMWLRRESTEVTYFGKDYGPTRSSGAFLQPNGPHYYYVRFVLGDSAAERYGLRAGDNIESPSGETLEEIVAKVVAGEEMTVARRSEDGVVFDVWLPDDEWLDSVPSKDPND